VKPHVATCYWNCPGPSKGLDFYIRGNGAVDVV
jgi:hypothetical protein